MQPYSTSILCGGKSSRMKQDKAMIDWNGKPLARFIADGFSSCHDIFLSVGNADQFDLPGMRMIEDSFPGCGPMAGLAASLQAARNDILFLTTCDAPLVDEQTAGIMLSLLGTCDAVVPQTLDHVHPLIAVYRKSVLEKALSCLSAGNRKMLLLLKELNVNYIDAALLPYGADTLTNLNTPEELAAFRQHHSLQN